MAQRYIYLRKPKETRIQSHWQRKHDCDPDNETVVFVVCHDTNLYPLLDLLSATVTPNFRL